jgi:hypothetical protein
MAMAFDEEQYRQAIQKIESGLVELDGKIQQIPGVANAAVSNALMPDFVRDAVIYLAKKIVDILSSVAQKIVELLKGAVAPIYMFKYAWDWQDIRGLAAGVVGNLRPEALSVGRHWHGPANDAYTKANKPQSDAAAKLGTIAERTATSLTVCAAAGLAFYVALGVIVVKFIAAAVTAIVALGSVVFSWAGLALIVEEAGVNTGLIIAAVAALTALLGAQASQMAVLHGEAIDNSVFPGGQWPKSTSGSFSDATVKDGDADWSLQP